MKLTKIIVLGLLCAAVLMNLSSTGYAADQEDPIIIYYFDNTPCSSCEQELEFIDALNTSLGDYKNQVKLDIRYYNTFKTSGLAFAEKFYETHDIPEEDRFHPFVYIGDSYVRGGDTIDKYLSGMVIDYAENNSQNAVAGKTKLQYFYVNGCGECAQVKPFLEKLNATMTVDYMGQSYESALEIEQLDISEFEHLETIKALMDSHNILDEQQAVPLVFIGYQYFQGAKDIKELLLPAIEAGEGFALTGDNAVEESSKDLKGDLSLSGLTILGVIATGLINGLNPCSLSMLLFFLSMLLAQNINILKLGISFILGKLISFILLGTVFYSLLLTYEINWLNTVAKVLLISVFSVLMLLNFSDFFAARNECYNRIRLQLPTGLRGFNHKVIKKFTQQKNMNYLFVLSFVLGVIIAAGEFLCTGQIYLATIIYVLKTSTAFSYRAVLLFGLYGVAFVLPLLIVTIVIHKTKGIFDLTEVVREKMPLIKLINGCLFLLFIVAVILFF